MTFNVEEKNWKNEIADRSLIKFEAPSSDEVMRLKGGVYNCIIRLQVRKSNFSWNNPQNRQFKNTSKQLGTQKRKGQLNQIKFFAYYYEHYCISCFYASKSFIEQFSSTVLHANQKSINQFERPFSLFML